MSSWKHHIPRFPKEQDEDGPLLDADAEIITTDAEIFGEHLCFVFGRHKMVYLYHMRRMK